MQLRQKVARRAAEFLYDSVAKEYKQAKEMAAESLGTSSLPTNFEVALELDELSDMMEGEQRRSRIVEMRRVSLQLMEEMQEFHPRLIGSVWRGTPNRHSDIDLVLFAQNKNQVIQALERLGRNITKEETQKYDEHGRSEISEHVYLEIGSDILVELVVRPLEDIEKMDICHIFGDPKKGLNLAQLKRVLDEDPLRKFIPSRRR